MTREEFIKAADAIIAEQKALSERSRALCEQYKRTAEFRQGMTVLYRRSLWNRDREEFVARITEVRASIAGLAYFVRKIDEKGKLVGGNVYTTDQLGELHHLPVRERKEAAR